ncbi:RuvA C-terminal domain-containing protein [Streptomyces sp. NPDC056519]|uniref:RuvA C-terminal domain-containing protein n=1 Tax=Streptomyces sp. NPDC056519 TaxID=3345849 RepID=UPI00367B8330
MSMGFRPTEADDKIIKAHKRPGESTSDVLRRALRALDRQTWDEQARRDMERIATSGEDLSEEPDDWGYGENGHLMDRSHERTAVTGSAPARRPWVESVLETVDSSPFARVMQAPMLTPSGVLIIDAPTGSAKTTPLLNVPHGSGTDLATSRARRPVKQPSAGSGGPSSWKLSHLHAIAARRAAKR